MAILTWENDNQRMDVFFLRKVDQTTHIVDFATKQF
jgi:hypothetical protein